MGEHPGAAPLGYETEAGWRAGRRGERQEGEASIRSLISLDRTAERVRFLAAMMDARATLQGSSYFISSMYHTIRVGIKESESCTCVYGRSACTS